jgi:uncharacterized SAM-binding protein YcdF (DUF218 family)
MKALSHRQTLFGEGASRDRLPNIFEQSVSRAKQRWHTVNCEDAGNSPDASIMKWIVAIALVAAAGFVSFKVARVAGEIKQESRVDEAQPADAIIVLGAAEYRGRPSPVLEARLNHALILYLKGMAPRVITTGGAGGDPVFTEGSVGRAYLTRHGVPPEAIVVEREGESTAQSVAAVVEIMRRMNLRSAIVVSDGYHIFRVKKMLESSGLKVYGSPRPSVTPGEWRARWQDLRQAVGYLLWRMGIAV